MFKLLYWLTFVAASLGEHKLRELNDEINKLIREKGNWERRILELGGPNYLVNSFIVTKYPLIPYCEAFYTGNWRRCRKRGGVWRTRLQIFRCCARIARCQGSFPSTRYAYNLRSPSLILLSVEQKEKTRTDLYKAVDADYYGFRDDEDGLLEPLEQEAEKEGDSDRIVTLCRSNKPL